MTARGGAGAQPEGSLAPSLQTTLDVLAQTIVTELGFEAAVINYLVADQRLRVVSVAGPAEVRKCLDNTSNPLKRWRQILDTATPWGRLRFLDHRFDDNLLADAAYWTPKWQPPEDPRLWHPEDALFAPLHASDGSLLGVLSVELPEGSAMPNPDTCDALEAFGVSASLAIEHAKLRERAEQSEELFREVFNTSPIGMALADGAGVMSVVNPAMCDILGRSSRDLVGTELLALAESADDSADEASTVADASLMSAGERRFLRPDRSVAVVELTTTVISGGEGLVLQLRDITDQRLAVHRLRHMASHDPVTEVGNRSLLRERLNAALQRRDQEGSRLALLFIDLDGFKRVNDAYSHAVGDHVLRLIAQRLSKAVRLGDTVARWGGDEFIVLAGDLADESVAITLVNRIEESLSQRIAIGNEILQVSSSIGVALSEPGDRLGAEELIRNADTAMYRAKAHGRSRHSVFDESLRASAHRSNGIEQLLRHAVADDRLVVHYQPIIRLVDGKVCGFEALMRLRTDDGELLLPDDFLALATQSGVLTKLERLTLMRACQQSRQWSSSGEDLPASVNVAVHQLAEIERFEDSVRSLLDETGIAGSTLTLELTEHAFLDVNTRTLEGMNSLVRDGVNFSVDDFGTGFASLTYLRAMPIHEFKIDRSFIHHTPHERASNAIVRAHATLARDLGVRCVAEGVETVEQHDFLRATGIEYAQGYLYAPGQSADRFARLLQGDGCVAIPPAQLLP